MSARVRLLDRLLAAFALAVLSPIGLAAALGIRLADGPPVLYRAQRQLDHERTFVMFKFRTMRNRGADELGSRITIGRDPRVFGWGRLLRRAKIDELPQLLNIVRGEMAIVGPRPEDPQIVTDVYRPWMMETLTVPPGLTSPGSLDYFADENDLPADPVEAQRQYGEVLLPTKLAADLAYVRSRSLGYDLMLVLRTLAGIVGVHGLFGRRRAQERQQAELILAEVGR